LAKKRVAIELAEWGYERSTFFPQPDVDFRRNLGLPDDALVVTAVSTQDPRKRFADIEKAVRAMNAYAVFLGQGRPRREGNAIYLGYVSDDVVRQAYSSSDVVVNWSAAEGFGLPTIEALACGARVVVPPDNPTLIEVGGEHVVVAENADIPSLCEAIVRAARMPRPQPDLSRFNWADSALLFESILWPNAIERQKAA
jgi:glycosyltransferase involved in cell wall biosynthesis